MSDEDLTGALIYGIAVRSVDQQASVVESIRTRAGILLSAAAVSSSFFAGLAIPKRGGLDEWSAIAVAAFVGVVVLCLAILWPRRNWIFRFDAKLLVAKCLDADPPVPVSTVQRDLSIQMEGGLRKNAVKLRLMFFFFWFGSILLGVEVVSWIIDLGRG